MEILKSYEYCRDGNDCLIRDYFGLIKVTYDLYLVLHITTVSGSWTGNQESLDKEFFTDYNEAAGYLNARIKAI